MENKMNQELITAVEDFFKVPFSHHITIFSKVKNLQERYNYIHRVAESSARFG